MFSREDVFEQVARIIAETFNVQEDCVTPTTTAHDIAGWDSLSNTVLMLRIESRFAVELDPSMDLTNVDDLVSLIVKKATSTCS